MTTRLIWKEAPLVDIRARAQRHAQDLAGAMVETMQAGFGAQSPSPSGAPPARKSGALARSIVAVRVGRYQWRVVAGARYAVHLEYGTKHMSARPFFLRALVRVQQAPPKLPR